MKQKNPDLWQGKTALVTGASSGIGNAAAVRFALEGLRVVLTARRLDKLNEVKAQIEGLGGQAVVIRADLEKEEERCALYKACLNLGGVDVLVNNAGFGWYGYYQDMAWETAQSMIHLNVEAVAHLTHLFLNHMKMRGSGHIINIGSIAGSFPNQGICAYAATKAYVTSFSTSLYRELRRTNIRVSLVLPGPVSTEFFDQASSKRGSMRIPAERLSVRPDRVINRIWRLLEKPRRVVYIPWWLRIVPWVELFFGWLIDLLGPLLLQRSSVSRKGG